VVGLLPRKVSASSQLGVSSRDGGRAYPSRHTFPNKMAPNTWGSEDTCNHTEVRHQQWMLAQCGSTITLPDNTLHGNLQIPQLGIMGTRSTCNDTASNHNPGGNAGSIKSTSLQRLTEQHWHNKFVHQVLMDYLEINNIRRDASVEDHSSNSSPHRITRINGLTVKGMRVGMTISSYSIQGLTVKSMRPTTVTGSYSVWNLTDKGMQPKSVTRSHSIKNDGQTINKKASDRSPVLQQHDTNFTVHTACNRRH
jgi:hypothetical protein